MDIEIPPKIDTCLGDSFPCEDERDATPQELYQIPETGDTLSTSVNTQGDTFPD